MTTTATGHRQSNRLSFPQAEADRRLEDCRRECEEGGLGHRHQELTTEGIVCDGHEPRPPRVILNAIGDVAPLTR
jgi:hypothetical protein